jgi:tRNA A37 methylthiotransferase MiaB
MEKILHQFGEIPGVERVRLSYLQPAEVRPSLLQAMVETDKVAPYFDLSFQHTSASVLRKMRRFGDSEKFLHLINQIRALSPEAGIRSNFIVGFPGESEADYNELAEFIAAAKLDAIGIFGYSDEDGTEAETLPDKLDQREIRNRVEEVNSLVEQLLSDRANERVERMAARRDEKTHLCGEARRTRRRCGAQRPKDAAARRAQVRQPIARRRAQLHGDVGDGHSRTTRRL